MSEPHPAGEADPGSICLACGVCCSGALFDHVPLESGEEQVLADLFEIEQIDGRPQFRLGCPHLRDTRCAVYERRPATCRAYRCKTLAAYVQGGIDRDEALRRIGAVRHAIADLEPHLRPGETMQQARLRRQKLRASGTLGAEDAVFALKAIALDLVLDRFMRSDQGRVMSFRAG